MNIRELAKELSLSTSTVSRALNGYLDVNAQTRQRVQDMALALGYRPDPGSGATLSGLAAELGAPVIETPDGAAAARAVTAALGTGPTEQAGLQEDAFRLAPWLALATLLPVLALWHSRRA